MKDRNIKILAVIIISMAAVILALFQTMEKRREKFLMPPVNTSELPDYIYILLEPISVKTGENKMLEFNVKFSVPLEMELDVNEEKKEKASERP